MPPSLLLSRPTLRVVPRRVSDATLGPLAVQLASGYGLTADPWQADPVECMLCRRKNGRYAAATVKISAPRQNGKNAILEIRELFGMVVLGEKFLHTAHEVKTARKAFRRIASFFENDRQYPELAAMVLEIRKTNGQEAILLSNGGSIEFIARSSGSGRGFTVDVLVLDEDQDLTDEELAALLPTISAAPLGNPQVILTGTPPDPDKPDAAKGEVARRIRADAIAGNDPNLVCIDYGVKDGPMPDVDDRDLWYMHNPALGGRLNIAEVIRERKLMSPEKFAAERLGWWGDPQTATAGVIDIFAWARQARPTAPQPTRGTLVIDVSPDRTSSSLGIAAEGTVPGATLVFSRTEAGMAWVVPSVVDLQEKRDIVEVALHPGGQAGALIPELNAAGVEFHEMTAREMGQACAAFQTGVKEGTIEHLGQAELDAAVANAKTKYSGEIEVWDRRDHSINITSLVSTSAAARRWAALADYDIEDSYL